MSVNVFIAKVLFIIWDTIFTSPAGDGTTILGGHLSHTKVYFKTLSFDLVRGIEPVTSCSTVKLSTDLANPTAVKKSKNIVKKFVKIV